MKQITHAEFVSQGTDYQNNHDVSVQARISERLLIVKSMDFKFWLL